MIRLVAIPPAPTSTRMYSRSAFCDWFLAHFGRTPYVLESASCRKRPRGAGSAGRGRRGRGGRGEANPDSVLREGTPLERLTKLPSYRIGLMCVGTKALSGAAFRVDTPAICLDTSRFEARLIPLSRGEGEHENPGQIVSDNRCHLSLSSLSRPQRGPREKRESVGTYSPSTQRQTVLWLAELRPRPPLTAPKSHSPERGPSSPATPTM